MKQFTFSLKLFFVFTLLVININSYSQTEKYHFVKVDTEGETIVTYFNIIYSDTPQEKAITLKLYELEGVSMVNMRSAGLCQITSSKNISADKVHEILIAHSADFDSETISKTIDGKETGTQLKDKNWRHANPKQWEQYKDKSQNGIKASQNK